MSYCVFQILYWRELRLWKMLCITHVYIDWVNKVIHIKNHISGQK